MQGPFTSADLPIDDNGCIYHLQLTPEEMAKDIIIVGDPGRAEFIADTYFEHIEVKREHRGLVSVTGRVKETGQRVTVITSGMGTASSEVVLNEIIALNEIDFKSRTRKESYEMLNVIRVGTCGNLQAVTPEELGVPIITVYAVGLDNSGLFINALFLTQLVQVLKSV